MFHTLEQRDAYMEVARRKAIEDDAADLTKAKAYFKGNPTVFANDIHMVSTYFKQLAESYQPAHLSAETVSEPKAEDELPWRAWLDLQGLNELRETAKKISTKISGNKQEVRDAIVAKLTVYEDMYKVMSKNELKDVCQTRSVKGGSTLAKGPLVNRLIRSYFEIEKKIVVAELVDEIPFAEVKVLTKAVPVKAAEAEAKEVNVKKKAEAKAAETKAAEAKAAKAKEEAEAKAAEAKAVKAKEEAEAKEEADAKKRAKAAIPKKVKTDVWNTYIGADINKHRCLCCKKTVINNTDFDVGHVVSEAGGGTLEIGNLRPICSACNHSMGTRNMVDFVKMFGYYIG